MYSLDTAKDSPQMVLEDEEEDAPFIGIDKIRANRVRYWLNELLLSP